MEEVSSATLLAAMRLAGVAPEVNLRERAACTPLQMQIRLPTLTLKPRGDINRSPEKGYRLSHKKDLYPPNIPQKVLISLKYISSVLCILPLYNEWTKC